MIRFTNKGQDSLQRYLNEVNRLPRISAEEEIRLAQDIRQGDRSAEQKLVNANLRFVISIAKRYEYLGLPIADLINEGNIGLITAARRFDETRGFKFISYAVLWIRQAILAAIKEHGRTIRLPVARIDQQQHIFHASILLEQQLERPATVTELATYLELDEDTLGEALNHNKGTFSYDRNFNEEQSYLDIIASEEVRPDEALNISVQSHHLNESLKKLSAKQHRILELNFGLDGFGERSFPDIGLELKWSAEGVRQNYFKALAKLRAQPALQEL